MQAGITYCFGDFEIQAEEQRVLVGGVPIPLGARAFQLLLALVQRAGRLVTKDELLEAVWPDVVVEENNLHVQISTLRKLLGVDAITTVVGRGYRFTPEISLKTATVARSQQAASPSRSSLPHHLGALIGRTDDLAQLHELLRNARLVTITGPGGVGKTRLMIAAAQEVETSYLQGAWLIELANQSDPQMVPVAAAARFGVEVKDVASATEALARHLRDKDCLMLLDNCEHLVEAVASLAEALLIAAPNLKIITTSQDVLGIAGEQIFRVPCLPLPPNDERATRLSAETALSFGAIRLFVERAKLGDPQFSCDEERVGMLVGICRRLDGIPLAIEMAAARVGTLGLQSVARLLDERFLALAAGRRTAIPRQRTLHATLDWSYRLLGTHERIVFRRLAGFVGGFSLAAAIAVASDEEMSQSEVIEAVSLLVTKSLLSVDTSQGHWRYRLLEVTRAYALEQLAESGEANDIARRAAEHYATVYRSCFDDWTHLSDAAFDARYAPDLENVCLGLDWAFGPDGDTKLGLDLSWKSGHLWIWRLMLAESNRRLSTAFACVDETTPPLLVAHLQLIAGTFFYWREWEKSIAALKVAVPLLLQLGEREAAAFALLSLANNYILAGVSDHRPALDEARGLLTKTDRARLATLLQKTTAMHHHISGNQEQADIETRRALASALGGGFEVIALTLEENLVDSMWLAGDLQGALVGARGVVEKCKRVKVASKIGWNWVYGNLFGILVESSELAEAQQIGRINMPYLREANTTWTRMDHYALYLAKAGFLNEAALVHGWIVHYFDAKGISHQPNESRARAEVAALLGKKFSNTDLAELVRRGSALSEDEVCTLALTGDSNAARELAAPQNSVSPAPTGTT